LVSQLSVGVQTLSQFPKVGYASFAVVVPQHQLNTFLASAEDLEILGLSKKCANIHIGAELEDYDLGPLELPTRRQKRLKRKREKAAATANNAETYEEPEIKQENSFDEVGRVEQLLLIIHGKID
jgi:hypothetical protein